MAFTSRSKAFGKPLRRNSQGDDGVDHSGVDDVMHSFSG
jgi:hypothetical protein